MAEYIEREAAKAVLNERYKMRTHMHDLNSAAQLKIAEMEVGDIPAADVRPVVRGKWNRTDAYPHRLYCSVCYKTYLKNDELLERWEFPLNFCPNCGADMREES